jgi:hypothetical protein
LVEGEFVVFEPSWVETDRLYPDKDYQAGANSTRNLLGPVGSNPDILNHSVIQNYFSDMYLVRNPVDDPRHEKILFNGKEGGIFTKSEANAIEPFMDFKEVARNYKVIDNANINILVPHPGGNFESLFDAVKVNGVTDEWEMRAKQTTVCRTIPNGLSPLRAVIQPLQYKDYNGNFQTSKEWFVYLAPYDPDLGVKESGAKP